jgi:hypothetical protein
MTCCGKTKQVIQTGKNIVKGYTSVVTGKKCKFTDARIRVCRTCEDNYWIGRVVFCSICKCPMPVKTRVLESKCPKDKWKD